MAIENITFPSDTINIATGTGGLINGTTQLSGTLTVDYTAGTVSGTLTDTSGNTYSSFTLSSANGNYSLVNTGGRSTLMGGATGPLAYTITIAYPTTTMAPSTVTAVSRSLANNTAAQTNNVPVDSSAAACFVGGTRFQVLRSGRAYEVAVEALAAGDPILTSSGAFRPIRWIGHHVVRCANQARPSESHPVRITAHAFGRARPARDLLVSPGHAICMDVCGEVLIPAGSLVNGETIVRQEVDVVTYWHVELDSHDVVLAENLPAESYLDMGNRSLFAASDAVARLPVVDVADAASRTHADFCRPFHVGGPIVQAARAVLERVAGVAARTARARAA